MAPNVGRQKQLNHLSTSDRHITSGEILKLDLTITATADSAPESPS
ncbi:MAG TPA: hypothetical protein V6D18_05385 [Thermosynechococcaceae cyanobacterium]|jgi:hypothetical protein